MPCRSTRFLRTALFAPVLFFAAFTAANAQQTSAAEITQEIIAELQLLRAQASTVFVGQILSVDRKDSAVQITFRVEQPIAGTSGQTFTLREWAGSWPPGSSRYLPGQRVLAFLHPASPAHLASPVHGAEGMVPVIVQGANAPQLVDVRRVAASVVRTPGTPLLTQADGAMPLTEVLQWIAPASSDTAPATPVRIELPVRGRPPLDLLSTSSQPALASQSPQSPQRPPVLHGAIDATR